MIEWYLSFRGIKSGVGSSFWLLLNCSFADAVQFIDISSLTLTLHVKVFSGIFLFAFGNTLELRKGKILPQTPSKIQSIWFYVTVYLVRLNRFCILECKWQQSILFLPMGVFMWSKNDSNYTIWKCVDKCCIFHMQTQVR